MVTFNTLITLIDDVREEIRNNNISESESISRLQIEQWIHQYRALLIKQDLDKGRYTNPDYVQTISLTLTLPVTVNTNYKLFSTAIPSTIDLHFKSGIVNISSSLGEEIQLMPKSRVQRQFDRKFNKKETVAYKYNGKIFVQQYTTATTFNGTIDGIFEDPSKVPGFSATDVYPIPVNMIPTLKELIFKKEFNITLTYPTDDVNNGTNEIKYTNGK